MEKLREPVLRDLHAYLNSRRGERPMPARADIDVVEIPTLLPFVFLVDVLDGPRHSRPSPSSRMANGRAQRGG